MIGDAGKMIGDAGKMIGEVGVMTPFAGNAGNSVLYVTATILN